jgi:hypothetical protein
VLGVLQVVLRRKDWPRGLIQQPKEDKRRGDVDGDVDVAGGGARGGDSESDDSDAEEARQGDLTTLRDPALLDDFLTSASSDSAAVVSLHLSSTALAASLSGLGDELESRRARGEELEVFTRMWQCRADAWGGVAAAASAILRHSASGSVSLEDLLSSEAVAGVLRGSGVGLAIIRGNAAAVEGGDERAGALRRSRTVITESSWGGSAGSVQDSSQGQGQGQDQGQGQGGRRVTVASDFVVVDEDRDVSVEVYCDGASVDTSKAPGQAFQSILSGGDAGAGAGAGSGSAMAIAFAGAEANIAPIAVDLVNALSTVIRSCVTSHRGAPVGALGTPED